MTLLVPAAGERFTVRIYKELNVTPTPRWANTYELIAESVGTLSQLEIAVAKLVLFEVELHLNDVVFDRAVLSTWVEDGAEYDPTSFAVYPQTAVGGVAPSGQAMPLNAVLFIRRETIFGRPGKLFYRRALGETDVEAPAGRISLTTAAQGAIQTRLDTALGTSGVDEMLSTGADNIKLGMVAVGQPARLVDDLDVVGATITKFDNRYFDVP